MLSFLSRFTLSFLLAVLLFSPCLADTIPTTGALDAAQSTRLLDEHEHGAMPDLVFLDVRTPLEFRSGHIAGALNIPVSELGRRLNELPSGPVLIVCRSGRRAHNAYDILVKSGRSPEQLWFYVGYTDYSTGHPRFRN